MKYLLLLAFLLIPATTQAVWFDSDWDYRVPVEIVPSKVGTSSAITTFPVFVSLADMPGDFWSNVQSDGDDIRVVESDETTETAFDLVVISTASSTGELHFLADSLSTTSTSTFYIYYGNAGASGYASTTTYGSQAVWTGYTDVVHLNEDPTGTAPQYFDSTGGSKLTSPNYESDDRVLGKLGWAVDPDGSNDDYIYNSDTNFINSSFSISWWVNPKVITNYNNSVGSSAWGNFLCHTAVGGAVYCGTQLGSRLVTSGSYWVTSTWYHMTYTYASGTQRLYKNGVQTHSGATASSTSNWAGLWLGAGSSNTRMDGTIDEVRTRVAPLSAAWIWTEFNNQSTTTDFYYVGAQETDGGGGGGATSTPSTIDGLIW